MSSHPASRHLVSGVGTPRTRALNTLRAFQASTTWSARSPDLWRARAPAPLPGQRGPCRAEQRPKLDALYDEVIATFEWPRRPSLRHADAIRECGRRRIRRSFHHHQFRHPRPPEPRGAARCARPRARHVMSGTSPTADRGDPAQRRAQELPFLAGSPAADPGALLVVSQAKLSACAGARHPGPRASLAPTSSWPAVRRAMTRSTSISSCCRPREYETSGGRGTVRSSSSTPSSRSPAQHVRAAELQRWAASEDYADPGASIPVAGRRRPAAGARLCSRRRLLRRSRTRRARRDRGAVGRARCVRQAFRSRTGGPPTAAPAATTRGATLLVKYAVGSGGREHALAWKFKQEDPDTE